MIYLILVFSIMLFGFVLLFGAPYLPTLNKVQEAALDLLDLRPGQTLLELGSGDGKVMKAAAKRGINVVGYELNPILFIVSYISTWRYRKNIKIFWANYWLSDWPEHDGIYAFLIDRYMPKLDKKIKSQDKKGIKLASNTFKIPGKKYTKEKSGVYLYKY